MRATAINAIDHQHQRCGCGRLRQRAGLLVLDRVVDRQRFGLARGVETLRRLVDGHQTGVLRHEMVLQRDSDHRGLDALRIAAIGEMVHQRLDLFPPPQLRDSLARSGRRQRQFFRPRLAADAAAQRELRAGVAHAQRDDERLAAIKIGHALRPRFRRGIAAMNVDRRHHRRVELREELRHPLLAPAARRRCR